MIEILNTDHGVFFSPRMRGLRVRLVDAGDAWYRECIEAGLTVALARETGAVLVCPVLPNEKPTMPYGGLTLWMACGLGRKAG